MPVKDQICITKKLRTTFTVLIFFFASQCLAPDDFTKLSEQIGWYTAVSREASLTMLAGTATAKVLKMLYWWSQSGINCGMLEWKVLDTPHPMVTICFSNISIVTTFTGRPASESFKMEISQYMVLLTMLSWETEKGNLIFFRLLLRQTISLCKLCWNFFWVNIGLVQKIRSNSQRWLNERLES